VIDVSSWKTLATRCQLRCVERIHTLAIKTTDAPSGSVCILHTTDCIPPRPAMQIDGAVDGRLSRGGRHIYGTNNRPDCFLA